MTKIRPIVPSRQTEGESVYSDPVEQSGNTQLFAYTAQTNPDSNNNSILDTWKIAKFSNANPGEDPANGDLDKDGLSNLMEYALDANPASGNKSFSYLRSGNPRRRQAPAHRHPV